MNACASNKATLVTLTEIAAWQIATERAGTITAALPALQRNSVWKVKQVEELWDSILRRFPIGAFIISPQSGEQELQNFQLQSDQNGIPEPTHLLLDGQQRATGIALGFYDIWRHDIKDAKSALWLDLAPVPNNRDVEFVFRVVTRAHPWGYKKSEPDDTISVSQVRTALQAFRAVNQCENVRPERLSLLQTWPWDAETPVPMAMLVEAVKRYPSDSNAARAAAWERIRTLPMFANNPALQTAYDDPKALISYRAIIEKQCQNVREAFELKDSIMFRRLDFVLLQMQQLFTGDRCYQVPLLTLNIENTVESSNSAIKEEITVNPETNDAEKKDATELLFIRVNSAGTPLAGEELIYSLLKAAWPDAAKFIGGLDHKPAQASRIAMLCVRLVLARRQLQIGKDGNMSMPPVLGVNEFRRLVRNQNPQHPKFSDELKTFIEKKANPLFTSTWRFLVDSGKSYTLLPVLAVEMAQKSPDVYLLLLFWADRLMERNIDLSQINEQEHRRTLGFLTALAWFAPDKSKACSAVWPELLERARSNHLIDFFNSISFQKTCKLDPFLKLRMIPLPSVKELDLLCKCKVTGNRGCQNTISSANSVIWKEWDWYSSFADLLVRYSNDKDKWSKIITSDNIDQDVNESLTKIARHFLDTLYGSRSILLYAQREWMRKWYPDFDPSQPEFMEDKNRPWDYDHIHPQGLLRLNNGNSRRNIPQVIRDWHSSIGNLRAWPLEANRSDSDAPPTIKLSSPNSEDTIYNVNTIKDILNASFVDKESMNHWVNSIPLNEDGEVEDMRYLANIRAYHYNIAEMLRAVIKRFIKLYQCWYEELKINDLFM